MFVSLDKCYRQKAGNCSNVELNTWLSKVVLAFFNPVYIGLLTHYLQILIATIFA